MKPLTLTKIIPAVVLEPLSNFIKKKNISLPKSIEGYDLIEEFKPSGLKSSRFRYGIYKNKKEKKAFAKMWSGYFKDLGYLSLVNEINTLEILNRTINIHKKKRPNRFSRIIIPRLLVSRIEKKKVILLADYFDEASTLAKLNNLKARECFTMVHDYLIWLGRRVCGNDRKLISTRSVRTIYLLTPLFLIKALINYPKEAVNLVKAMSFLIKNYSFWEGDQDLVFGHRDLHLDNILYSKKKDLIYVIDFQYCIYSSEIYDLLSTVRVHWNDKKIKSWLLKLILQKGNDTVFFNYLKVLIIVSSMHGLTGESSRSDVNFHRKVEYFKFAVNGRFRFKKEQ